MEDAAAVVTIKQLVLRGQPLAATSSLESNSKPTRKAQPLPSFSSTNPNPKILTPLNYPAILIGVLTLPNQSLKCSNRNCFQFSDESATICCDVLDFRVNVIGKRIYVLAWNFIPFKHFSGAGFLEIIKWSFVDSTSSVLSRCSGLSDSFPLVSGSSSTKEDQSKARYHVHGPIEWISPVFTVPCSIGSCESDNLQGFIVRFMICECKLCNSNESAMVLHCVAQGNASHCFIKPLFVYFCGASWCWHPVITKLVGCLIMLSGLKKKLVFIRKEESQLMFVTAEHSILHFPRVLKKLFPFSKNAISGNGECGVYTGVVKGVYMQGMAVELDKEVWLLLTDQLVTAPHSLREGAIISVRNVHLVNPKFSWTKMLILGACFTTSFMVESFSPLETGCHMVPRSLSQLGKFIESLTFSARLWTLLVISGFRKKFTGILSEREILGSKQKEGLAQMFASLHIPASIPRARQGVLTELCKHESCGCGSEPYRGNLKPVAPISFFLSRCENMWMKTVLENCHAKHDNQFNSHKRRSYGQPTRKIFSSEDVGIILLGSLKISPSSGKLQLVDATGSIDVMIPELPSTWKNNSIYEVVKYNLIIEGKPEVADNLGAFNDESASCRCIFHYIPQPRKMNLSVFAYFNLSSATCKNLCFYPPMPCNDDLQELQSGRFHLIWISHKFPMLRQLQGDPVISDKTTVFVEAVVLPWDLFLDAIGPISHSGDISRIWLNKTLEHHTGNYQEHLPNKRHNSTSSQTFLSGLVGDPSYVGGEQSYCSGSLGKSTEWKSGEVISSLEIPCLAMARNASGQNVVSSGKLYCIKCKVKIGGDSKPSGRKVLLEFSSESFFKYQLLQIGGYYMTKHYKGESFCSHKDCNNIDGSKIYISSRIRLWSLSFSCYEVVANDQSLDDASQNEAFFSNEDVLMSDQVEPLLRSSTGNFLKCSDVHLHLAAHTMDLVPFKLNKMKEGFMPTVMPEEAFKDSPHSLIKMSASGVPLASSGSSCLFPEGNLISVLGNVVAIHGLNSNSVNVDSGCETKCGILSMGYFQGIPSTCCIHVLVDKQMVRIFGSLSKHAYAVGFGAGVNATFHRILKLRGTNRLMLTPVSYIAINSMRIASELYPDKSSDLWSDLHISSAATLEKVSSGMISELIQSTDCKPVKFNCRVVTVHILVLENKKYDLLSKVHSKQHFVDVPLAAFVLDDGSSSSRCWANAGRAATLLRLHEELPIRAFESSGCTLKWVGIDKRSWKTTMCHLERILNKHHRIIVKNHGSTMDSLHQDLIVSVSSDVELSSSDENLLKSIILNACFGAFWTVTASAMDSDAVTQLEKEHLKQIEMTLHPMQNVWAMEVCRTNTLVEAWKMVQDMVRR